METLCFYYRNTNILISGGTPNCTSYSDANHEQAAEATISIPGTTSSFPRRCYSALELATLSSVAPELRTVVLLGVRPYPLLPSNSFLTSISLKSNAWAWSRNVHDQTLLLDHEHSFFLEVRHNYREMLLPCAPHIKLHAGVLPRDPGSNLTW